MKLTYTVTQDEYCAAVTSMLRQRRKTPVNILLFLFMTVVQFAFALRNFISGSQSAEMRTLLLVISACILLAQLFYQSMLGFRAKAQMRRDMRKGRISPDFWQKQQLSLNDDVFSVKCGKSELKYDCAYYSGTKRLDTMLLISFTRGKAVHQLMIPFSAFNDALQPDGLIKAIEAAKRDSIIAGLKAQNHERPQSPDYSVTFSYDREGFCRDQIRAARWAYLDRIGWTLSTVARVAAAVFLLYHLIHKSYTSVTFMVFVVCVIILLLYPLLIAFTPLCSLLVRKNALTLFGGMDTINCSIDASDGTLCYMSEVFYNEIPYENIYSVICEKKFTALYLKDNSVVTIPLSTSKNPDVARLAYYFDAIADGNWRSRSFKSKIS